MFSVSNLIKHWLLFTLMVCLSWCHKLLNKTKCHEKNSLIKLLEVIMVVFLENVMSKEDI
jgi:hypothetical protein